ncbi:MAG TPA: hypothetical protein VK327_09665 [Candidatus Paceibacterota bacterium]|nr:hypothetical protein [Candidatus Paceibacterota bacterium]
MADKAQVTSVEAIDAFRARLIIYTKKARAAVEEAGSEVYRTRQWLANDQRRYWEDQLRVRRKKLERAQDELSSARLSSLQDASTVQQMIVRKCREAVQEAEGKLAMLKKWDRELENRSEPLLKQMNQLEHTLNNDMPKAIAYLNEVVKTLEAYAGILHPSAGAAARTDGGSSGMSDDSISTQGSPEEKS